MINTVTLNPAVDRELTVPDFAFNQVLRASGWQIDLGGKGFNVSRMLHSLGIASRALAFAGGKSGELLQSGLGRLGILTDFIWVPGETRTNISIVNEAHDRYLKVNEPGPTISEQSLNELLERVQALVQPGHWWVFSGSLPPGLPAGTYARLIEIVRAAGGHTALDSSGEALRAGAAAGPDLVKPNAVELADLTGLPTGTVPEILAAARQLHALGPSRVVISLGKEGALALDSSGTHHVEAPAIDEKNPIGSGDALVAGLVWGLDQGLALADALRWGVACGAATAASPGTAVGSRAEVERLHAQTHMRPLAGSLEEKQDAVSH